MWCEMELNQHLHDPKITSHCAFVLSLSMTLISQKAVLAKMLNVFPSE